MIKEDDIFILTSEQKIKKKYVAIVKNMVDLDKDY